MSSCSESRSEKCSAKLSHALESVARVDFRVGEDNWRSRKAMEKIGGRLSSRRGVVEHDGRCITHIVYEITRASFAEGPLLGHD